MIRFCLLLVLALISSGCGGGGGTEGDANDPEKTTDPGQFTDETDKGITGGGPQTE
jgi:hypothetical protein